MDHAKVAKDPARVFPQFRIAVRARDRGRQEAAAARREKSGDGSLEDDRPPGRYAQVGRRADAAIRERTVRGLLSFGANIVIGHLRLSSSRVASTLHR